MSDAHDVSLRKSDDELKEAAPPEAVGVVPTDTSLEQEASPDVTATEREREIARLKGEERDLEREIEELNTQLAELEEGRFGHYLIESVYVVILIVTVGAWIVLGFAVWLPLLVRTTTLLAGSIFYHSLFRDQARVVHAQRSVHFAVRFYVRGFDHFLSFYRQRGEPDPPVGLFEPLTTMKWKELLVECAWVIGVWAASYLVMHSLILALFRH